MPDLIVNTDNLIGVRLALSKFGKTRTCTKQEKAVMTNEAHAKPEAIRASKVLIDSKDVTVKKLDACQNAMRQFINAFSQPSIIEGVRHMNVELVDKLQETYGNQVERLEQLKAEFKARRGEIMASAKDRLGDFYSDDLFPGNMHTSYSMMLDFPDIKPDERLKKIDPAAYEAAVAQYMAQVTTKANEALDTLLDNTADLVNRMIDILTGGDDGKPKTFRKDTFETWALLFDRFKSITSVMEGEKKDKADAVIHAAESMLDGITPTKLRTDTQVQQDLTNGFKMLQQQLAQMVELQPDRAIDLDDDEPEEFPI